MRSILSLGVLILFWPIKSLPDSPEAESRKIGRPVRVVSLGFRGKSLEEVARIVEREGAAGADLIILPETFMGQAGRPEALDGPTISTLSALAKKHRTYLVCPLDRLEGTKRLNSAVLLDREGKVAGLYDKVFPYWSEFDLKQPVDAGQAAPVFTADFGRLGLAICFDVNFPEVWQRLADQGAELVVWPSAYSGGASLQAHALNHHFYVVTATQNCDCAVYDLTGEEILYEKTPGLNASRITLDLDRGIYHENFNRGKLEKLLQERVGEVKQTKWLEREQWFVLQALVPGASARALARQYGLEELRDYLSRSRREIDARRGWKFAEEKKPAEAPR
ncbi:MAG: carbon-nitrogen hydrolase family protein [Planctomycetes bacterium]|nr:carbon-nitrogen hydrolase family protein [Planctomycetota bacterium]